MSAWWSLRKRLVGAEEAARTGRARCLASFLPRRPELTDLSPACIASAVEVPVAEFGLARAVLGDWEVAELVGGTWFGLSVLASPDKFNSSASFSCGFSV
jgi:hypothetical protein